MENINCIFCNIPSNNIIVEENGFTGRKCQNCHLIYISPRPSLSEILTLYRQDNAQISAKAHIGAKYIKTLFANHTLDILKKYAPSGDLLEIGAGAGFFLVQAKKKGFNPYAIELNSVQSEYINNTLNITCESDPLSEKSFNGREFDVIYHSDIISHFFNPIEDFKMMNKRLKNEGILIFETGNLGDVDQSYYRFFTNFQYPDHLFLFSKKNLLTLLKNSGFELETIISYSIVPHLLFIRFQNKIIGALKRKKVKKENKEEKAQNNFKKTHCPSHNEHIKSHLKKFRDYTLYFLRYKLGKYAPKKGRPQTLILVARKKTQE